jgi:6-phosphogluconolactonase
MATPNLFVTPTSDALAAEAANRIIQASRDAIQQRGRFTLVLSGGSTPEKTYQILAKPGRPTLDWSKTYLFFGDERFVPPDDPQSNYGMAKRSLLDPAAVAQDHVFAMPTNTASPATSAQAYGETLGRFFSTPVNREPPRFDMILLGLGDDGHTASLFPGAKALAVQNVWVTWSPPGTLPPPVDRITFTYPLLNAAQQVLFLVAGAKKAEALRDIIEGQPSPTVRPAAGVRSAHGSLTWLVDEAAAGLLKKRS